MIRKIPLKNNGVHKTKLWNSTAASLCNSGKAKVWQIFFDGLFVCKNSSRRIVVYYFHKKIWLMFDWVLNTPLEWS